MAGPALRWALDEADGAVATDSSGNHLDGAYTGVAGAPTPSALAAPLTFANPRSRLFSADDRQAVRRTLTGALKPTAALTVSAWYQATGPLDTMGGELVSGGNSYYLRLKAGSLELGKRIAGSATSFATCAAPMTAHLDGKWHHVAGVHGPGGLALYFDGVSVATSGSAAAILYDQGPDLWVGRHGKDDAAFDFNGNIDDVRVYGRALSGPEIARIATRAREGLALHWRLDETAGTTAADASGNNLNGTYTGATSPPASSTMVPPVTFEDPQSRGFAGGDRQAVRLSSGLPPSLKPANDLSLSVWYRATMVDGATGAVLISAGNNYALRLLPTKVELIKRVAGSADPVACQGTPAGHLDGAWHHVAGVLGGAGMTLYFDGAAVCSNTNGAAIAYDQGTDLWVGRDGNGDPSWDFDGLLDEVRIYPRALTAPEVSALKQGGQ